jgi:hypothetical protein
MGNSSGGSLGGRILAWVVIALVALFALKLVFGLVLGLFQFLITLAVIGLVAMAVIWALRHI